MHGRRAQFGRSAEVDIYNKFVEKNILTHSNLKSARELTDKPFAVNINLFPTQRPVDNKEYVEIMIEKGVKIVETSGHSAPQDLCERFKEAGMTWMHKCVGIRYALKVQNMGADIVTVVGYENGGATGKLDLETLVLVPCDHLHPYADMGTTKPHDLKVFNLCLIKKMGLESWAKEKAYPFIMSSGRHMDYNANTSLRDPAWNKEKRACTAIMHPGDAEEFGFNRRLYIRYTQSTNFKQCG